MRHLAKAWLKSSKANSSTAKLFSAFRCLTCCLAHLSAPGCLVQVCSHGSVPAGALAVCLSVSILSLAPPPSLSHSYSCIISSTCSWVSPHAPFRVTICMLAYLSPHVWMQMGRHRSEPCVCVCKWISICMYVCMCVCVCMHVCMFACTCACVHVCV